MSPSSTPIHRPSYHPQRVLSYAQSNATPSNPLKRPRSPIMNDDGLNHSLNPASAEDRERNAAEQRRAARIKDVHARSERMLAKLFDKKQSPPEAVAQPSSAQKATSGQQPPHVEVRPTETPRIARRPARAIDEDDYGDDDEDEEDDHQSTVSPLHGKGGTPWHSHQSLTVPEPPGTPQIPPLARSSSGSSHDHSKTTEEARKKLEEEKKAAEDAAKRSFQQMFYTLENDRDAMLEQQKLDELERQVDQEMSGQTGSNSKSGTGDGQTQQGSLSNRDMGTASLTLRHLISKIDQKRGLVSATDSQIKTLFSDVRKNRSKWANEDKVGQEELYEACEKVLMELKAQTEWSTPFLQSVKKRDAPDYNTVIKNPMDLGSMLKRLRQLQYNSKKDFVADLNLIWSNCLRYNQDPSHPLRKKAEQGRKESERLSRLIPEITIRNRAEMEAEERRNQLQADFDDGDDSDDEPIAATRGRMAPGKTTKKGVGGTRKTAPSAANSTPVPESRTGSLGAALAQRPDHLRSDVESNAETGSQHGIATPPPTGALTPQVNGAVSVPAPGSHADASEVDGLNASMNEAGFGQNDEAELEDEEYKTWKKITKKDRAQVAAERHRLFKDNALNLDAPALLRTKARMRRWMAQQKQLLNRDEAGDTIMKDSWQEHDVPRDATTLAEGIEASEESTLPDYYDPLAAIPALKERLLWKEDSEGYVIDNNEECLRMVDLNSFKAPESKLQERIEQNMRQMQDTRKVAAKIGIVKQMQVQAQTYQNQFQKYDPDPFTEHSIEPMVVSDDGPIMSPWLCRAALQRSVGKIFYHAGFEDFQPSALEAATDIASDYFQNLVRTLKIYHEAPRVPDLNPQSNLAPNTASHSKTTVSGSNKGQIDWKPRFSTEELLLHTLSSSGIELDGIEDYISDAHRLTNKLETHHSRMRDYLTELLRPALDPSTAGADGVGAFQDGSEQFVGGDFAEDIDEDFFGFRELGLDRELGISGLSVPLHLLQSRVHSAYQPANAGAATSGTGQIMETPSAYPPLTLQSLKQEISIVQQFFAKKLEGATEDEPLIEDDELPAKQRFPKPRLPPTGKISSPRKRPIREQQMMARKKRRMEKLEIEAEKERERKKEEGEKDEDNGKEPAKDNSEALPEKDGSQKGTKSNDQGKNAPAASSSSEKSKGKASKATAETNGLATPVEEPLNELSTSTDPPLAATNEHAVPPTMNGEMAPKALANPAKNNTVKLDPPRHPANSDKAGDPEKKLPNGVGSSESKSTEQKENGEKKGNSSEKENGSKGGDDATNGGDSGENEKENGILSPKEGLPIAAH